RPPPEEPVSWVEQNRRAVSGLVGTTGIEPTFQALTRQDRDFATRLFATMDLERRRPLVAIHPSGGRLVKQWPVERWAEVGLRLQEEQGATLLVTGSEADRPLSARLASGLAARPI